ncbi:MAG: glycoside hydrolase family 66 protein [Bacteroidetes bacterium]|nr:glycoside hydrolase family 66 protein [Bacteroidota bacterium]
MKLIPVLLAALFLTACGSDDKKDVESPSVAFNISTDKSAYKPSEIIQLTTTKNIPSKAKIRYKHLNSILLETSYLGSSWTWQAPSTNFKGYTVTIYTSENGIETIHGCVGVDVSSDWSRFPRYGFLSKFSSTEKVSDVITELNRYHLNGLQFYDWHYKHHQPLAGTVSSPAASWKDIINRTNYLSTVKNYIAAAHEKNMKAMFYNLAYGATNTAQEDGVAFEWFLFKDQNRTTRDFHDLPEPPFNSDIYVTNPANTNWQSYLISRNQDVYSVFDFDGFHIDQLGDRGTLYDENGSAVNLSTTFGPFIQAMKSASPDKKLVFNAVNQYGQIGIAQSPVDFLYTEVWSPNESYSSLATIIKNNDASGSGEKKSVLAAYMNYKLADKAGMFNTPSVLLTDAVIFAFGGAHLELGEHMLGKEYFPNSNLQMTDELKKSLISYYDFMVGYQNLLRDGGSFNSPPVVSPQSAVGYTNWPPVAGRIAVIGKLVENRQVIHLINFSNTNSLDWRDTNGTRTVPVTRQNLALTITVAQAVKWVWIASPDLNYGSSVSLSYQQVGNSLSITVPSLKYWDMIVIEY